MIINTSSYTSAIPVALNDNINIPGPIVRASGTTTSLTNDKLVDTNANFVQVIDAKGNITNQGVQRGQIVYNMAAMNTTSWLGPEAAEILEVEDNNSAKETKQNIIVHLKCYEKDLIDIGNTNPVDYYSFSQPNQNKMHSTLLNQTPTSSISIMKSQEIQIQK